MTDRIMFVVIPDWARIMRHPLLSLYSKKDRRNGGKKRGTGRIEQREKEEGKIRM